MVSIDTVYQKVLALTNKEQRGYITPQEFNLFADQAQKNIFEQYFYDLNQFLRVTGNSEEYSDIISNLREKIVIFERLGTIVGSVITTQPGDIFYRLGTIRTGGGIKIEEIQFNEDVYARNGPLTSATSQRPTFMRVGENDMVFDPPNSALGARCTYTRMPTRPEWGYFVVGDKALYDPNPAKTTDFELHPSDESELVYKILKLAGVSMKRDDIMRAGQGLEAAQVQQEKQ